MTSDLMVEVIRVSGARVERVVVTALRERTFYAAIFLAVDGHVEKIDARPSDALNLAVRLGTPIFVAADVLEKSLVDRDELDACLDREFGETGAELPPGEWRSLSAELLREM
ncbi:MAG TPA: bifunctional nuclease family protein, partial [Gaiellaceae bacterium]|nr:bifunctional nuclease family protein [Gaiellaceae bacterium]